jgi:hypothetical protein
VRRFESSRGHHLFEINLGPDAREEEQAAKRPVYFKVPENWDDLSDEEQEEIADQIIDAMMWG